MASSTIKKGALSRLSESEIVNLVKKTLDEMDIPYEEQPGGFGFSNLIDSPIGIEDNFVLDYEWAYTPGQMSPSVEYHSSALNNVPHRKAICLQISESNFPMKEDIFAA